MLLPPSVKLPLHSRASRFCMTQWSRTQYVLFSRALASILHRQEPDDGIHVSPLVDQPPARWHAFGAHEASATEFRPVWETLMSETSRADISHRPC